MEIAASFCCLCLLLLIGKLLRTFIPVLQAIYLPSAVIGGVVGLVALTVLKKYCPDVPADDYTGGWSALPGFLISVVFATIFIGSKMPRLSKVLDLGATQLCYGQICAWGQYVVGLGLAMLLLIPVFGVHPGFGTLLEIGFSGGHGTVGGMTAAFDLFGWEAGSALGFTMATAGMVLGIVIGMMLINLAVSRGWVKGIVKISDRDAMARKGLYLAGEQPSAGKQTIHSDSLDSLAFHIALVGLAVFIGYLLKVGMLSLNNVVPDAVRNLHLLESFPLFPLCMIGGLIVQGALQWFKWDALADNDQMTRISGASLDFLVVAAVATIRIEYVIDYWQPLLLLIIGGTVWNVFCLFVLGPRLFREAWFERSITEFGQNMGVTATGLMLLRTVDPENKTVARMSFGYKQLLHEPIMGGGIWTSMAFALVLSIGNFPVFCISLAAVLLWLALWYFVIRPRELRAEAESDSQNK